VPLAPVAESVLRALAGGGNGYRKAPPTRGIRKRRAAAAAESAKFPITGKRLLVSKNLFV
jgi:hypothetical protein